VDCVCAVYGVNIHGRFPSQWQRAPAQVSVQSRSAFRVVDFDGEADEAARRAVFRGRNRIGNMLVPNDNYCKFEDWLLPILDTMLAEQKETGEVWSPSKMIWRLGKEINNSDSICYWAWKNGAPSMLCMQAHSHCELLLSKQRLTAI
jgi:hypothetical protein